MMTTAQMYKLLFIFVLLLQMHITLVASFCPAKCKCDGDYHLHAACIGADLDVVPIQLNPDVKYINLTKNRITNVHFTLAFYTKLEILDLSINHIDTLGTKNFESQIELQYLYLNTNIITRLLKDTFRGLINLLFLDLSKNFIEEIHTTAMLDLKHLKYLNLADNRILSMNSDTIFQHLYKLETLLFYNNQLLEIPSTNLAHLNSLLKLDLSGNLIELIQNDSFNSLTNLNELHINGNVIGDIELDSFHDLNKLQILTLADNNLTVIPTQQLSKLINLTFLSLSGNYFNHIPAVAFLNLFHLRELHLNRLEKLMRIDPRAFVDNTFLEIVTLDNNPMFSDLPPKVFHGNPNILKVSIRANNIQTLDAVQFPLDRLQSLKLADNPLVCNCSLLWLWQLTTGHIDNIGNNVELTTNSTTNLDLDINEIGCNMIYDKTKTHRILRTLPESEIKCPAHIVTVVSAVMSVLLVLMVGGSVLIYIRYAKKRRKKALEERKNVNERIVPQQVDKFELDRYLAAAQVMSNEYRTLRPWEMHTDTLKECTSGQIDDDSDHYEKFEYTARRSHKQPHIVYV